VLRRAFWIALGIGAGAAGAIVTMRLARRQARKVAPATLAREARGGIMDIAKLFSEAIEEGKAAMRETEDELSRD
jgi:choline dehydrogenase-like flavoprotein